MCKTISATEARKNWSEVIDETVHDKPQFIRRNRDHLWLASYATMLSILKNVQFHANEYSEPDGSITLSLDEIDLTANEKSEEQAKYSLADEILDYAEEYYADFSLYSRTPNRKDHVPYVFKALLLETPEKIKGEIVCRPGRN